MKAKPPKELIKALLERDMPKPAAPVQPTALLTARTEMNARQTEIFSFVERYLFDHENPTYVSKNVRFVTEGYDAFGLDDLQLKELRNEVLTRFEPSVPEIAGLLRHFFATGKYEFGSLGLLLLKKHRPRLERSVFDELRSCLDNGVENWAHCDLIALKLTPVLLELSIATLDDFVPWTASASKWTRRVAAVTLISQRTILAPQILLDFVRPLMQDREKTVQQGVGWFLRELWKNAPQEVEDFLFEYKDKASQNLLQNATEKMHKDKKRRFVRPVPVHQDRQQERPAQNRNPNHPQAKSQNRNPNQQNAKKPFHRKPFKPRPPKENPDE